MVQVLGFKFQVSGFKFQGSSFRFLVSCLALVIAMTSCREEEENEIPNRKVNLTTSYSDFMKLRNAGAHIEYEFGDFYPAGTLLGYGGILIFRDYDNKLHAADLACPVEADENVTIEVNMPYAICKKCNTKYDLTFGFCSPVSGPGKVSLRMYEGVFERGEYILVRN